MDSSLTALGLICIIRHSCFVAKKKKKKKSEDEEEKNKKNIDKRKPRGGREVGTKIKVDASFQICF